MTLPKQSVTILGRRWFEKRNGNTYHSATIMVDGETVHKIDFAYGYGNQFEWNAWKWLEENGYMPEREHSPNGSAEAGWRYFRDNHGLSYAVDVVDVLRKKDL